MEKILNRFNGKKILVIGDIMLDKYVRGNVKRISPEAPVPIFEIGDNSYRLGGASNVANNIKSLGGIPILTGIIGQDGDGEILLELLKENGIKTDEIIISNNKPTVSKTRIIAHNQQILRMDREEISYIGKELEKKFISKILDILKQVDGILFEDYDKGIITPNIIKKTISAANNKVITADPKFRNFFQYKNISLFKPNIKEMGTSLGEDFPREEDLLKAGKSLRKRLNSPLLITRGSQGMILFDDKIQEIIPSYTKEIYDVTGAGDTVIAAVTLALASGGDLIQSAKIASIAAGIEVGKFGASAVTTAEIKKALSG